MASNANQDYTGLGLGWEFTRVSQVMAPMLPKGDFYLASSYSTMVSVSPALGLAPNLSVGLPVSLSAPYPLLPICSLLHSLVFKLTPSTHTHRVLSAPPCSHLLKGFPCF